MRIYGDSTSGNCMKVKWTCDFIGRSYDWTETSVVAGDTRKPGFLDVNPAGQVPAIVFDDGRRHTVKHADVSAGSLTGSTLCTLILLMCRAQMTTAT